MPRPQVKVKRMIASLLLFGVSFGFVEAAAVVYMRPHYEARLRGVLGSSARGFFPLSRLEQLEAAGSQPARLLIVELIREGATLAMLAAVGLAVGKNLPRSIDHGRMPAVRSAMLA